MPKKNFGIIAGQGDLPGLIQKHCKENNIRCCFAFIDTKPLFELKYPAISANIGQVGKILNFFKEHKVTEVILSGGVQKPDFFKLKVDLKGSILLTKILKNKLLGDNSVLTTVISYLENLKYKIISIDELLPNLHLSKGLNNKIKVPKKLQTDIELGIKLINNLSSFDIGQAVIVQNGRVLAIEAAEGTDAMIARMKNFVEQSNISPAILVKLKKISQDRRVDLPTIGIKTLEGLVLCNIGGIVLDACNTLVIEKEKVVNYAEKNNIFIYGIDNTLSNE